MKHLEDNGINLILANMGGMVLLSIFDMYRGSKYKTTGFEICVEDSEGNSINLVLANVGSVVLLLTSNMRKGPKCEGMW